MNFDDFDAQMRRFETSRDTFLTPDVFVVARLDGRNFTRPTKEQLPLTEPFDDKFHGWMTETVQHLMTCGFRVLFGYTQSDEISLLFHRDENAFGRKERKWNSVLAGEASAKLSLLANHLVCFDCRLCPLPTSQNVVDYFRWRSEDAHRNALNAHCYWALRSEGVGVNAATKRIENLSNEEKLQLLKERDIVFALLPQWQKRGAGIFWQRREIIGHNPLSNKDVSTTRRALVIEENLPEGEQFSAWLRDILDEEHLSNPRRSTR